ncbi:Wzt carbohydrate-binding domain-containing protein [Paraburkholderia phenazinium]|nr:Wzt carbohydrate-binding domain-containing protein [Paraburkholderia phenazinium]
MAITSWLTNALGAGTVTPDLNGNHSELLRGYGGLFPIISAHIIFDGELDPRYDYITLLRDPVDRVLSWLFYAENTVPDTPEFQRHKNGARNFLQSNGEIVDDEIRSSISNYYVEHFAQIQRFSSNIFDGKVAAALQSLSDFKIVGLYEDYSSFLSDVSDLVCLPDPGTIATVNPTNQRPKVREISPALRERIVELNQLDIRLYEEVVGWKVSAGQRQSRKDVTSVASKWQKYEPVRDRVITTPDITILTAALRGEAVVFHGDLLTFDVDFFLSRQVADLEMGVHVFDSDRRWAFGINSSLLDQCHQDLPRGTYRVIHHLVADLPAGSYTAGFAFSEKVGDGVRDLAWYDKLCEFEVHHRVERPFAGYANLSAEIALTPLASGLESPVVEYAYGSVALRTPPVEMVSGEHVRLDVEITNHGDRRWIGDGSCPVRLSYHWLGIEGEMAVFDGERSSLPDGGVPAWKAVMTSMSVVAPPVPGRYTLVPTLVQEGLGWLEEIGLETAAYTVVVTTGCEVLPG